MHASRSIINRSRYTRVGKDNSQAVGVNPVSENSNADVENLKLLGIEENVVMIPHGIYPPPSDSSQALPVDGRVMGTFGFLLPHKGQLELVEKEAWILPLFALDKEDAPSKMELICVTLDVSQLLRS